MIVYIYNIILYRKYIILYIYNKIIYIYASNINCPTFDHVWALLSQPFWMATQRFGRVFFKASLFKQVPLQHGNMGGACSEVHLQIHGNRSKLQKILNIFRWNLNSRDFTASPSINWPVTYRKSPCGSMVFKPHGVPRPVLTKPSPPSPK